MMKSLAALCLAACVAACGQAQPSAHAAASAAFLGTDVRQERIGGDFTLTDGSGRPFALSSLKGRAVVLAFGFTHCPDVCPTELVTYQEAVNLLGEAAKEVAVVFVSVDPERDNPELVGKYVAQFHRDFIGLTATAGQDLAAVKKQYRIVAEKTEVKSDTMYNVDHTSGAYLLDRKGNVAVFEPFGADAAQIAADLRRVLSEK